MKMSNTSLFINHKCIGAFYINLLVPNIHDISMPYFFFYFEKARDFISGIEKLPEFFSLITSLQITLDLLLFYGYG